MKKIFVLAPKEDWICDRIAQEWNEYFPDISVSNYSEADTIWLLASWCWNHIPVDVLKNKKVITTIHHIVPDKFDSNKYKEFLLRDQFTDVYHILNETTYNHVKQLTNKRIEILSSWFDSKKWFPVDKNIAQQYTGLIDNTFKIGSFQRDTEGFDNLTPKLEKGPDIFCDVVEQNFNKFQNKIQVVLAGWRRNYIKTRLSKNNINYIEFEKASLEFLRNLYASLDLYIVSSRFEGGPQSILEAAAMKVPIISTNVGIVRNIISNRCIMNMPQDFLLPNKDDIDFAFEKVQNYRLDIVGKKYKQLFMEI